MEGQEFRGLPWWLVVKNPPAIQDLQETQVQSQGQKDPLEGVATLSSILGYSPWGRKKAALTETTHHKHNHTHASGGGH